jgi:hypothetical protein
MPSFSSRRQQAISRDLDSFQGSNLMRCRSLTRISQAVLLVMAILFTSCAQREGRPVPQESGKDDYVTKYGEIEVTAKLVEIPEGAIFKRDLYDYATVLKYQVLKVHRGKVDTDIIYVGQYNPFKPRYEAADQRVKEIGGDLKVFRAGQVHRMALVTPIDDYFMGGLVNKYFGQETGPIFWALWTNLVSE